MICLGIAWPFIKDGIIQQESKDWGKLSQSNMDIWKSIPGVHNISTYQNIYVYECINTEDYGPFMYKEYLNYSDPIDWNEQLAVPGQPNNLKNSLTMTQQFESILDKEGTDESVLQFYNTKIDYINIAAQTIWYTKVNSDDWEIYIQILQLVVFKGLGTNLVRRYSWQYVQQNYLQSKSDINKYFCPINQLEDTILSALFNDKEYGFAYFSSFQRWQFLSIGEDPVDRYLLINELRDHFGLTYKQTKEFEFNWNKYSQEGRNWVYNKMTSEWKDDQAVAYWQWADSYLTRNLSLPGNESESITQVTDTHIGYPELSFFKTHKLLERIKDNQNLYSHFKQVNLFQDRLNPAGNFEYLFDLNYQQTPPSEISLFNITTLQKLLVAGSITIDIVDQPHTPLKSLDLSAFDEVTKFLRLEQNERSYLIYLWLKYCRISTVERDQDKVQLKALSQIGAKSIKQSISKMEQEFPILIYAQQFENILDLIQGCEPFYQNNFGLEINLAQSLCDGGDFQIATFNWSDIQKTAFSWINIYLNGMTNIPRNYVDLLFLLGWSQDQLELFLYDESSKFKTYLVTNILQPIQEHYKEICTSSLSPIKTCTNKELTYHQWLDQKVLLNSPDYMISTSVSYAKAYTYYTKLNYGPELGYYLDMADSEKFGLKYQDVVEFIKPDRLFNNQIIGNIIEKKKVDTYSDVFNTDQMGRTPKQMMEGYTDPLIYEQNQIPIYEGGNQLLEPHVSFKDPVHAPKIANVSLFTGAGDDYLFVKKYARWLGNENITVSNKYYANVWETQNFNQQPWTTGINIDGTDSYQFHPDISEEETLQVFNQLVSRNMPFQYTNDDSQGYQKLKVMNYQLADNFMKNSQFFRDNQKYRIYITNTQPLDSIYKAPVIATKGNYLNLEVNYLSKVAQIVDQNENPVYSYLPDDDSFLSVDKYSGLTLQKKFRFQLNIKMERDQMIFDNIRDLEFFIIPYFYQKRETVLSNEQALDLLDGLYSYKNGRMTGIVTFVISGFILIALAFVLLYQYRKIKRLEILGIDDKYEHLEEAAIGESHALNNTKTTLSSRNQSKQSYVEQLQQSHQN
eukprot:403355411